MKKINFKQPKYIFPAVVFVPLCFLVYFVMQTFGIGGDDDGQQVATDQINMSLPEARAQETRSKLLEMQSRYGEEDAYTAIGALGDEQQSVDSIDHGYSEAELNAIDAEIARREMEQRRQAEIERQLTESRRHVNSYSYDDDYEYGSPSYQREMNDFGEQVALRQAAIQKALGLDKEETEAAVKKAREDSIAKIREDERIKNLPNLVIKSQDTNAEKFNTVSGEYAVNDSPLIRAMIDKTTKAHEGTRLRFKLLDNISVKGLNLPKGTYLYGTVSGFGQQRVMANITSILIGNKFVKVNLSVFDNDGMEGFYVPESAFRDFMKDAGASAMQNNINFSSGGYGSDISGEAVALQALQNVYSSATNAVSTNMRKNRARIKYNTIVYLINSEEAK